MGKVEPESPDKWVDAVYKINKLTKENTIKWAIGDKNKIPLSDDEYITALFETKYKKKKLRLLEKKYKQYKNDPFSSGSLPFLFRQHIVRKEYWEDSSFLEIIDDSGMSLWTFPVPTRVVSDLIESVKYQIASPSDFLDDLFEED